MTLLAFQTTWWSAGSCPNARGPTLASAREVSSKCHGSKRWIFSNWSCKLSRIEIYRIYSNLLEWGVEIVQWSKMLNFFSTSVAVPPPVTSLPVPLTEGAVAATLQLIRPHGCSDDIRGTWKFIRPVLGNVQHHHCLNGPPKWEKKRNHPKSKKMCREKTTSIEMQDTSSRPLITEISFSLSCWRAISALESYWRANKVWTGLL